MCSTEEKTIVDVLKSIGTIETDTDKLEGATFVGFIGNSCNFSGTSSDQVVFASPSNALRDTNVMFRKMPDGTFAPYAAVSFPSNVVVVGERSVVKCNVIIVKEDKCLEKYVVIAQGENDPTKCCEKMLVTEMTEILCNTYDNLVFSARHNDGFEALNGDPSKCNWWVL